MSTLSTLTVYLASKPLRWGYPAAGCEQRSSYSAWRRSLVSQVDRIGGAYLLHPSLVWQVDRVAEELTSYTGAYLLHRQPLYLLHSLRLPARPPPPPLPYPLRHLHL